MNWQDYVGFVIVGVMAFGCVQFLMKHFKLGKYKDKPIEENKVIIAEVKENGATTNEHRSN